MLVPGVFMHIFSSGQLLSILFEDLFKRFVSDFKKNIDQVLSKHNRATNFDPCMFLLILFIILFVYLYVFV